MTTPPPDNPEKLTPDYRPPPPQKPFISLGCSIVIAIGVASLCAFAIFAFIDVNFQLHATVLIVGILIFTATGVALKKIGMNAALAIFLTALCSLILMCSLCSTYPILGPHPRPAPTTIPRAPHGGGGEPG